MQQLSVKLRSLFSDVLPATVDKEKVVMHIVDVQTAEWITWEDKLHMYEYPNGNPLGFAIMLLATVDSMRIRWLLSLSAFSRRSVLLTGDSSIAKTATINTFLANLDWEKWVANTFNFGSATSLPLPDIGRIHP